MVYHRYNRPPYENREESHLYETVTDTLGYVSGTQRIRQLERAGAVLELSRLKRSSAYLDFVQAYPADDSDTEELFVSDLDSETDVLDKLASLKERIRSYREDKRGGATVQEATTSEDEAEKDPAPSPSQTSAS